MTALRPAVLFVCVRNASRSQMAAGWLTHLAGGRLDVSSAGSQPTDRIDPLAVEAMREVGVDISAEAPKKLTFDSVARADVVITMGCGDVCPIVAGTRYEDWAITDPAGHSIDVVREVREEIRGRVEALRDDLLSRTATGITITPMTAGHGAAVLAIYQAGIDEGNATFETSAPTWAEFTASKLPGHRYVALDDAAAVLGWVAATAVSDRGVYAGVVEHSIYVAPSARGRGVGTALLNALIDSTEGAGIWTIQSGIFPENAASGAMHRSAGFRQVGRRERLGQHHGIWRDVILIERRSAKVG